MRCSSIRRQMVLLRELTPERRTEVRLHASGCRSCGQILAAYESQEQMLSRLPVIAPRPTFAADVYRRIDERQPTRTLSRRLTMRRSVAALAAAALALLVVGGTVRAAADSLPGDVLYPVKRVAEAVRSAFELETGSREAYHARLDQLRRDEALRVVSRADVVEVEFVGILASVELRVWSISEVQVVVSEEVWPEDPPIGETLRVVARAGGGRLEATRVTMSQTMRLSLETIPATGTPTPLPGGSGRWDGGGTGTPHGRPAAMGTPAGPGPNRTQGGPSATLVTQPAQGEGGGPSSTPRATGAPGAGQGTGNGFGTPQGTPHYGPTIGVSSTPRGAGPGGSDGLEPSRTPTPVAAPSSSPGGSPSATPMVAPSSAPTGGPQATPKGDGPGSPAPTLTVAPGSAPTGAPQATPKGGGLGGSPKALTPAPSTVPTASPQNTPSKGRPDGERAGQ